jgi:uncharacterized membrane protein
MQHRADESQRDQRRSVLAKRSWLMAIGCGLPIVAVLLLPMFGVSWGTALLFLLVLACPLMHLLGMHGGHHQPGAKDESRKEP